MRRIAMLVGLVTLLAATPLAWAGTLKLTWTDPAPTGGAGAPSGHNIYRSIDAAVCSATDDLPGPAYKAIDTMTASFDDASVPDVNGTVCYEITAKNAGGESGRSNRVSKATTVNPPMAPVLAIQ